MEKTSSATLASQDRQFCQQALADVEGWRLYKQWMQDTEAHGLLSDAIRKFQEAIWYRADPQSYYHLALCYEARLQMTWETAEKATRRHLLQLARAQCAQALELDCRHEFQQRVEELKARLQALEATPATAKPDPKPI
jgi:hypothetical protein